QQYAGGKSNNGDKYWGTPENESNEGLGIKSLSKPLELHAPHLLQLHLIPDFPSLQLQNPHAS
uniref:hypothetical protein n=1 Tax=Picosynechococcus sp. (strain ATCC 27264 / PCC 7002 / PR-6) TaxID=32049 RepID=UPI0020CB653F